MGFSSKKIPGLELPSKVDTLQQVYSKEDNIKDVLILKANVFRDDYGGWFKESSRLDDGGNIEILKDQGVVLKVRQTNVAHLAPGTRRFWHIHPIQNEMWTTDSTLLVGLIDLRKNSPTYNKRQKIILSLEKALFIPHGVAHGFININNFSVSLCYFADQQFVQDESTQEFRIDPQNLPFDFVEPELM